MSTEGDLKTGGIGVDWVAYLAMRPRAWRHGVDRVLGRPDNIESTMKLFQP
jgi:hypothetical protein